MTAPVAFSTVWHVLTIFLVFLSGIFFSGYLGSRLYGKRLRAALLYFYHTLWCLVFFWYSNVNGADSFAYYHAGVAGEGQFGVGTQFVVFVVGALANYLGLSYLGIFLVFNIFGALGYIFFDGALIHANRGSKPWAKFLSLIVILLPSICFWSSAISKDAISFLAVGASLWSAINLKERLPLMVFSILAMLMVRPHMAGMLIMSLSIAVFFDRSTSSISRFLLSASFILAAYLIVPFALDYVGIKGGSNVESVSEFIDKRQSYATGGSAVDITSMSFFEKMFTYAFRPTLLEVRSVFFLAASLDNIILLFLFVYGAFLACRMRLSSHYGNKLYMFSYSIIAWSLLSLTTPNLGIALRQKWMFVPFVLYLAFSYLNQRHRMGGLQTSLS